MWCVIQAKIETKEEIWKQSEKIIERDILEKCFISYCKQMIKYHGECHKEKRILFPGYVFLVSEKSETLYFQLKHVIDLIKLINAGQKIVLLK